MPTFAMPVRDATNQSERILSLWQGSWIAALAVGVITWGLILWPAIAFRRKRGATDLPPQTRYNLPIEVFYTVVPVIMIAVFFYFTARDEEKIMHVSSNPDHTITVTAVQWSWQFTYDTDGGPDATTTGTPAKPPTLYLRALQAPVRRRHPLLLGARVPVQDGRHPGAEQQVRDHAEEDRDLRRQMCRAVRKGPRPHAVQRPGRDPR
jgi:cytochrome c oxidase subunit 2